MADWLGLVLRFFPRWRLITEGLNFGQRTVVPMDDCLYMMYMEQAVVEILGPKDSENIVIEHTKMWHCWLQQSQIMMLCSRYGHHYKLGSCSFLLLNI